MKIKTCPFCGVDPRTSEGEIDWVFSESEDEFPDNKQLVAVGCFHCGCHGAYVEATWNQVWRTNDAGEDKKIGDLIVNDCEPVSRWNLRYRAKNLDKNRK